MQFCDDKFYIKAAWIMIAGGTIFRLIYSGAFLLAPDEANYWQWSRHMALGYHDQAPMIAWAIRVATLIFGHTEAAVRLPSVLAMAVASAYMVATAKRWISPFAAFNTSLLIQSILIFNIGALLATADGIQAAAWAAASYHVARAYDEDTWPQWLLGGLWFGFGMLSKYTMVIFLPGVFLYGIFSKKHRQRLTGIWPYAGVLIGFIMFMPVIFWNVKNGWNSFRHVAYIGGANEQFTIHLNYLGDYLVSQAGSLSPLVFILIILGWSFALRKRYKSENWIYPYLFFTSFPMFAGFALLSLHTRVYGNWPTAGYLTATILISALFAPKSDSTADTKQRAGQRIWPWAIGTSYAFTALLLIHIIWPVLPIPIKLDRTATELSGWKALGEKADEMLKKMPNPQKTFVFGFGYQVASELAFYTPGNPRTVSINKWKRPNVYDYWWKDEDLISMDAIGITYDPESHINKLNQVFDYVDPPIEIKIFRKSLFYKDESEKEVVEIFYLYRAYDFKGGTKWTQSVLEDIRAGSN